VFWASQNTHTFHPSFINDLNSFHIADFLQEGTKGKLIFDLITGEKQSTMADTFSRYTTFSLMFEHFKTTRPDLEGPDLYREAALATDENMVQYGQQYKAPIFRQLGVVGDMMSPLQTFASASLGNMISDVQGILRSSGGKAKLRAALPFMMTTMISGLMTGAIGVAFVAEYEMLRLLINKLAKLVGYEGELLPSIVDTVMKGDNTFANRTLSHGLISSSTMSVVEGGLDLSASNRFQAIYGGALIGEQTFMEMLPSINFAFGMLSATTVLIKDILTDEVSDAAQKAAILQLIPGGYDALFDMLPPDSSLSRTEMHDAKGRAVAIESGEEKLAKAMGTNTIVTQREKLINRRLDEKFKRDAAKMSNYKEIYADYIFKGETDKANDLAMKLAEKYNVTPDALKNYLKKEMIERQFTPSERLFMKKGPSALRKQGEYMDTYMEDMPEEGVE
jgi:hypothetical protein